MSEFLIAASVLVVVLLAVWVLLSRQRGPAAETEPYRVWAVARANTSDGITSRIEVEVLVQQTSTDPASTDPALVGAVEDELRQRITANPVASLPSVGDDTPYLPEHIVPGHRVLRGVVTISDVEVTPELRRLVTDCSAP